ncbi:hypothetical protein KL919_000322 [Ogataea angusta]|uniref:Uncharacterized protein n=1 Tax=Pichia angusta TaxID=870730 RepID=A0AAN6I7Y7_PICAN|nr:uncharacterized protein KL928_000465 [Ogataea angusta]KAG7821990.1 hypothetical protein KL928_000465 [Ogataea angusta]KAG7825734.1 hypothetical protein KL909_000966 [Ogataea angusta]KAG7837281.1 hypothetical protein KL943_001320 [Ogataea angusta]KAG7864294.1 hypothetical protein KL919_000322 [Ogataea angusta]
MTRQVFPRKEGAENQLLFEFWCVTYPGSNLSVIRGYLMLSSPSWSLRPLFTATPHCSDAKPCQIVSQIWSEVYLLPDLSRTGETTQHHDSGLSAHT